MYTRRFCKVAFFLLFLCYILIFWAQKVGLVHWVEPIAWFGRGVTCDVSLIQKKELIKKLIINVRLVQPNCSAKIAWCLVRTLYSMFTILYDWHIIFFSIQTDAMLKWTLFLMSFLKKIHGIKDDICLHKSGSNTSPLC